MTDSVYASAGHSSMAERIVDDQRAGSVWGQVIVGAVGIALALILVVGQVSLATTKGIQRNLAANVGQIREGNATMQSIIEKAQPATVVDAKVASQRATLERTNRTMTALNREMTKVGASTGALSSTVQRMEHTSSSLAGGVGAMQRDTERMAKLLGKLPGVTDATHQQLSAIGRNTGDINAELEAIAAKMERYGLPRAEGVQKR